jgi:hypothetical protein
MSTFVLFRRQLFPHRVNIQSCFTLQRKDKLWCIRMVTRPWANAVTRLLRERGLKGKDLVDHGRLKRQGTVSAVMNSEKTPKLATLLNIAQAIEKADHYLHATNSRGPVETWEFFVNEDQSALLRTHDAQRAALVKPPPTSEQERQFAEFLEFQEFQKAQAETQAQPRRQVDKPRIATHKVK